MTTADLQEPARGSAGQGRRRLGWLVVLVITSLVLGGATAFRSAQQSLWIDELHTSWTCADTWHDLVPRAAIGNQTPIYFAWQWIICRTFGHSEVALRATSLFAWAGSLALFSFVIRRLVVATGCSGLWLLVCLAALDRQQIFFASEARPYMAMSLVVFIGWLMLEHWLTLHSSDEGFAWPSWFAWVGCCATAMWLQPTAGLFVAAQFAAAIWRGRRRGFVAFVAIPMAIILCLAALWPMQYVLEPAWQGRQAWAAFAANLNWQNVLRQLPILVVAVPGAIAWLIVQYQWRNEPQRRSPSESRNEHRSLGTDASMWFIAWTAPLAFVLVLTACEVAPLMHARYLFAATLPMIMWAACMLARLGVASSNNSNTSGCVWGMIIGMLLLQTYQQGSLHAWKSGRLAIAERTENWRGAVAHIKHASQADDRPIEIYCASNLIEGGQQGYLDGQPLRFEYLSLPLRAMYQPGSHWQIAPLVNDPTLWPDAIEFDPPASGSHATHVQAGARWLLVRATSSGLAKRLQLARLQTLEQIDFGAVQLVRF